MDEQESGSEQADGGYADVFRRIDIVLEHRLRNKGSQPITKHRERKKHHAEEDLRPVIEPKISNHLFHAAKLLLFFETCK